MAVISVHHPLAFAFGILGNIVSFLVYVAPVPTFWRIYRRKSTECFRSLPYLVALFSSMLWLYYATLKKDALLLITINSFGCVIETIYISMFIAYAPREKRVSTIRTLALMDLGLFSLIMLVTQFLVKASARVLVLGWINVAINLSVFAAPLSIVAQVIRTRSVEFMPFTLSLFLTLTAATWFFYGLFSKDLCVALPNVLGFILGLFQMLLYAMYKNANKVTEETKLPDDMKTIVIVSTMGVSEVYPVEVEPQVSCESAKMHNEETEEPNKHDKGVEAPDQPQPNTCEV